MALLKWSVFQSILEVISWVASFYEHNFYFQACKYMVNKSHLLRLGEKKKD